MAKSKAADSRQLAVGDEAVKKATGKTWDQWIAVLDKAGCRTMNHKQIVAVVGGKCRAGGWWQQMVTVGYEQAAGLRAKHQKVGGYSVSASRTIDAPVSRVFEAFGDAKRRAAWLGKARLEIRRATPNKSMRVTWLSDSTHVDVNFYARGAGRSMVAVQHEKLPDDKSAAKMKAHWGKALDRLKACLG
jgi:uncharacterized protein YndB with AHSA1/START domain